MRGSLVISQEPFTAGGSPLPAERHPQQQRDHLQRPAQIAEIMHFPPRPDLSGRAAIRTLMHAVRRGRTRCMVYAVRARA